MEDRPKSCERAAQFLSLELDGELSLFERAMLKRHLQRCALCAVYAQDVTRLTELMRAAPLEPIHLPIAFSLQRRRVSRMFRSIAAAAAVVAVGVGVGVFSLSNALGPSHNGTFRSSRAVRALTNEGYDWPAGLPRTVRTTQLFPGSLYTDSGGY